MTPSALKSSRNTPVPKTKKPKVAKDAAPVTPEPVPGPESAAEQPVPEVISKSEAVRRAIAAGVGKPTDGVAFIKAQFGLGHCRGGGPHSRGCWVVDGVLGKG